MRIKNVTALKERINLQLPLASDIMSTLARKFREKSGPIILMALKATR